MNEAWKRIISAFLVLVMVFQMVPVTSLAAEHQDEPDDTVNWDMPEPEEPDVVGEVEELRDHTSKQFRLSDGSFAAVNYGIPVHYLDENNNWVDVDNTLTYSVAAGQYMSVNGDEQRGFADTLANGQPVLVSQYENYSVELTLLPMTYETVRDEAVVMDQEEDMADAAESEPASEATEVPETEPTTEETVYTEPVETTVPEETNPVITEPAETTEATEPSEPELSGESESTSETLGTDAEAAEESEAPEAHSEPVEETEVTEATIETEFTEPVPETTVPEETMPETTLPETTVPVETIPETTAPVETVPETTIPEEDTVIPETTEPEDPEETVTETVMPSNVSALVLNPGEASMYSSREDMPLSEQYLPEKMGSHVIYEGVFPGIDLMYENYGYQIKETILVNELQESYAYSFLLTTDGLTAALSDSGSITLTDVDGEVIYEIPSPYMFDAAGETSYDVAYSLEEIDGDYILTITADAEWIEDEERVLPVSIDPTISLVHKSTADGTLYTNHVVAGRPKETHKGTDLHYVGYSTGTVNGAMTGECRIYTHVAYLPSIPAGCEMVEATLQYYVVGDGYSFSGDYETLEIAAYQVTEDESNGDYHSWLEGLTWCTKPAYSSEIIDYAVASEATQGSYIQWDLTKQVLAWYKAGSTFTNRTLALVGYEPESYEIGNCGTAVLRGSGTNNPPMFVIKYRSMVGLENYFTYQTQNIGNAGTAYIGDYSGKLSIVKNIASQASGIMPVSLNLVYNSAYEKTKFTEVNKTGMNFGYGWKLDAIQTLTKCTGDLANYLLYIDGDGTSHYFKPSGSEWKDEDGLNLTIKKASIISSTGSTLKTDGYAICNDQGDQLLFYNGYLVQQKDETGNKIFYLYNNAGDTTNANCLPTTGTTNRLTKILQWNKGASSGIEVANLTYDDAGYLSTVSDRIGDVSEFIYSSGRLTWVKNSNKAETVQYKYSSYNLVEAIDESSKYKIIYAYKDDRIDSFMESGSSNGTEWTNRVKVIVKGSKDKTTYRSPGVDGIISNSDDLLTTYLFDDEGRTINSYTTNAGETVVYGAATGAYAQTNSDSALNNHLLNSASIGTAAQNLLVNGNFETTTNHGWTLDIGTGSGMNMALRTDGHRTGNSALKTYFNASTTGTLHASKKVTGLISGQTYTLSGYVNTTGITAYGSGGGIYLSVSSGGSGTSETIDYITNATIDNGWERLSVTFKATSNYVVVNVYAKNAVGIAYIDDLQVENGDAPSNVNLVTNGAFETSDSWIINKTDNVSYDSVHIGGESGLKLESKPTEKSYFYQTIPINLPKEQTYVLSGWAKADALPNNQPKHYDVKLFTLKAEVYYTDGEKEEFFLPFSSEIDGEWQFVSGVIAPSREGNYTVDRILVYGAYHYNVGEAYFDNLSLVREPAQTMKYDSKGNLVSVTTMDLDADINTYENGNLIQAVTSGHGTFAYTYDNTYSHRLTSVTNGVVTQSMGYDSYGNVNKTTLSGSGSKQIVTSAKYTDSGNLTRSVTNAAGKTTSYAYGSDLYKQLGAASAITSPYGDGKTVTTNHTYDHAGRVTESCRFVNDALHIGIRKKNVFR